MKKIKRIKNLMSNFNSDYKTFGWNVAISSFIFFFATRFPENILSKFIIRWRHSIILSYLNSHYRDIIFQYKNGRIEDRHYTSKDVCIWVCWWQGEEFLDELTKSCVRSIREHANGHKVILITSSNYKNYVSIPSYIMDKLDKGTITLTQFSDILRMTLLNNHGGLWLDATMFVTKDISEDVFKSALFTRKGIKRGIYVSDCQWTGFFMGGASHNMLFDYMNKMFFEYWKTENRLIDYYLIDYLIRLGYETVPAIKELIDSNPFNNPELHSLEPYMNSMFNKHIYNQLVSDTSFFKLSRKSSHVGTTSNGDITFYGKLILNKTSAK